MSKHLLGVIGDSSLEAYQQSFESIIIIISIVLPLSQMDTTVVIYIHAIYSMNRLDH